MKTVLIITEKTVTRLRTAFPDRHPLLAPICNKPLLEYLLDFAILCGSRQIRIVADAPVGEINAEFGNGGRWGIEITYGLIRESDEIETILNKNSRFCSGSRLLILEGCFFLHYDKNEDYEGFLQTAPAGTLMSCATGRILIRNEASVGEASGADSASNGLPPMALSPIQSAGDLHRLSLRVLGKHAAQYVLPGYNNEPNVYIGRNVMIAKTARIIPPVMIGNHVQIHKGAVIGPDTVIGNGVIIDADSQVQRSVVLNKSYVGAHLELNQKLVDGSRLIDPEQECTVLVEDRHLLSPLDSFGGSRHLFQRLSHGILAAFLCAVLALPYAVAAAILKLQGRWHREERDYFADKNGLSLRLAHITIDKSGWVGRVAASLAVDRFPWMAKVVRGKLALIGTALLPATEKNRSALDAAVYFPGVFSYADAENWPAMDMDRAIVERFHLSHRCVYRDILLVLKAMINNLHEETIV